MKHTVKQWIPILTGSEAEETQAILHDIAEVLKTPPPAWIPDKTALLIKAGSALDIRDSLGMSAYDYAKLFRHGELLSLMDSRSTRESTEH